MLIYLVYKPISGIMGQSDKDGDMHRHVDWMVPADVSILEYMYHSRTPHGRFSVQTPNTMAINTGYSNRHTSARAQVLADHGLCDRLQEGHYRLTDRGRKVVEKEIGPDELDGELPKSERDVDEE